MGSPGRWTVRSGQAQPTQLERAACSRFDQRLPSADELHSRLGYDGCHDPPALAEGRPHRRRLDAGRALPVHQEPRGADAAPGSVAVGRHPAGVADRVVCLRGADAGDPVARRPVSRSAASAGRRRWPSTWRAAPCSRSRSSGSKPSSPPGPGVVSFPVAQSVRTYFPVLLALGFHGGVLCYWLIIGLQALWRFHESSRRHEREALELMARASALETQVVQARLGALKMQLQPHFLFNTLNAVVSLVRARRGREAEDTLAHLSDLLRWVLDDSEHQEVPLARELEYVRLYLAVERVRFADRLRVDMRIAPGCPGRRRAAPVPAADRRERDPPRHRGERGRRRAGDRRPPRRRHAGARRRGRRAGLPQLPAAGRHRPRQHAAAAGRALRRPRLDDDGERARRRRHRHAGAAVPRMRGARPVPRRRATLRQAAVL